MKSKVMLYIKNNPEKAAVLLWIFNYFFGLNIIRKHKKNKVDIKSSLLRKTKIVIKGANNAVNIGSLSRLKNCRMIIAGNKNRIIIEKLCYLHNVELCIEDDNNEIYIGKHTIIYGPTHLAAIEGTSISIGEDCLFSSNIHFRTGDSHSVVDINGTRINKSKSIIIGNHVWIGTNVICLKGTYIEDNCIVGAGTVTTKQYAQKNSAIAGNPAHVVKSNINWLDDRT